MLTKPGRRGCGVRQQNGLYLCVGQSVYGHPIEEFVLDPCRLFKGEPFRAPILVEKEGQPNDVLIWIGANYYPFVPDFVEEARQMGISRRIPRGFPLEGLVPFRSRMILVHSRAIPAFEYEVDWSMAISFSSRSFYAPWCERSEEHECAFNLWPLALMADGEESLVGGGRMHTTSGYYDVEADVTSRNGCDYAKGAFAAFWVTHLEYVNSYRRCPSDLVQRAREVGLTLEVVEE